ncbi:MAG: hypothetical protein VYE73_18020 [Acidobacteriota bacterium]|nr:hypothetical protein [Acidobacteriota bacterium]
MRTALVSLCCGLVTLLIGTAAAHAQALPEFEIQDQFETVHRSSDYGGQVFYVLGSDREGGDYNEAWADAIKAGLGSDAAAIPSFGIADLSAVPRVMERLVRPLFPSEPEKWALMDWDGVFKKTFGLVEGAANILVFDTGGRLVHQAHGTAVDPKAVAAIVETIHQQLDIAPTG